METSEPNRGEANTSGELARGQEPELQPSALTQLSPCIVHRVHSLFVASELIRTAEINGQLTTNQALCKHYMHQLISSSL